MSLWLMMNKPYIFPPETARILYFLLGVGKDPEIAPTVGDERKYHARLQAAGMGNVIDVAEFEKLVQPPTHDEAVELAQRDMLVGNNPAERQKEFKRLQVLAGYTDPTIQEYLWKLRERLPTEGELIEAAVKNAFPPELAEILKLDEEYEEQPQFIIGTDRLGLSGTPFISLDDMTTHLLNHRAQREAVGLDVETIQETTKRALKYFKAQDRKLLT